MSATPEQIAERLNVNAPRPYDVTNPDEVRRLLWETIGYMRVSLKDGTDFEGRRYALDGLQALHARAALKAAP